MDYEETISKCKSENTTTKYTCKLKRIKRLLYQSRHEIPIDTPLENVDPSIVVEIIAADSKFPNGNIKAASSPEQARSAILWHYRYTLKVKKDHQLSDYFMTHLYFNILKETDENRIPAEYRIRLNDFVKGAVNTVTKEIDLGNYK